MITRGLGMGSILLGGIGIAWSGATTTPIAISSIFKPSASRYLEAIAGMEKRRARLREDEETLAVI